MMFRFPIPFMPPFLSFDLAAIPELIGAFALGPVAGVLIVFIRVMVQMVISGSNSMFTGELQSFLLGVALVLPASLLYRHKKTRKEALLGMTAGTLVSPGVAAAVSKPAGGTLHRWRSGRGNRRKQGACRGRAGKKV